jgi:hypothetical protein
VRFARGRLVADAEGITVYGVIRTRRIPWSGIRGFNMPRWGSLFSVNLNDGRTVAVWSIGVGLFTWLITRRPRAVRMAEELNALLATKRASDLTALPEPQAAIRPVSRIVWVSTAGLVVGGVVGVASGRPALVILGLAWLVGASVQAILLLRVSRRIARIRSDVSPSVPRRPDI